MFDTQLSTAQQLDAEDSLAARREQFHLPHVAGETAIYLCGNSLGLQPKRTAEFVNIELDDWAELGVEGHTDARNPWLPYHEFVAQGLAHVVGSKPHEVVAMNGLTVNLHLLMVSFYRPTKQRFKIIIEKGAFPSDRYAMLSQLHWHGVDLEAGLIELAPRPGDYTLREEDILAQIAEHGEQVALIMLGGVNYLTGQAFPMQAITQAGHAQGAIVGFDLAHAAGNLCLNLHDWQVDFAAWCSYKYLNSGPGGIAGCFIHENHLQGEALPRFSGWWGHDKASRFKMPDDFLPIAHSAEAWQLSNPPILQLAALRAALVDFVEVTMPVLRGKSERLTTYLCDLLEQELPEQVQVITPKQPDARGSQLSLILNNLAQDNLTRLQAAGVICDFREPNVIRVAPTALYNRFVDVYEFVQRLKRVLD